MPELPKKKVGIVACSGEELPEGTVTRLAALKVLEELRPEKTVTICLPLFLAGGEGDRAFAKFYPTIAIDGCERRCAARGTEKYSARPAGSIVVTELLDQCESDRPSGLRQLDDAGKRAVEITAQRVAETVDEIMEKHWSRKQGTFIEEQQGARSQPASAACACGTGIPVQKVNINGTLVSFVGLPIIFEQLSLQGKNPTPTLAKEILETVRIYNLIPDGSDDLYEAVLLQEYMNFRYPQENK